MKYTADDARRILDEARAHLERGVIEQRREPEPAITAANVSHVQHLPRSDPWFQRNRPPQPEPREPTLDTLPAPEFDMGEVVAHVIAHERERMTEVVGEAIGEVVGQLRQELQREVDTLRALQSEARAQQQELRAALDALRTERRRDDSDERFTAPPATSKRIVN
jgi:hypothetical protein